MEGAPHPSVHEGGWAGSTAQGRASVGQAAPVRWVQAGIRLGPVAPAGRGAARQGASTPRGTLSETSCGGGWVLPKGG